MRQLHVRSPQDSTCCLKHLEIALGAITTTRTNPGVNSMQSAPLKTILVVDDDFSVLTAIKCMLEASHDNVLLARTADVAISIAQRKGVIDLLLMDVVMSNVSGPDLAETILALHPSAKVLFLSSYGGSDVLGEGHVEVSVQILQNYLSMPRLLQLQIQGL